MTFTKGDRVKVEFEATVRYAESDRFNLVGVVDEQGEEYWVPISTTKKIEKVYPAGSVWVWRLPDGSVDSALPGEAYTVSQFSAAYSWASVDNIIAIHEPEEKS
jgi:hypothetical protein